MAKINMKLPKKSKKEMAKEATIGYAEGDRYPYGLEISLENDSLKKLGLKVNDHKVKDKITISADTVIESTSSHQRSDGTIDESLRLQITDLEIDGAKGEFESEKFSEYHARQNAGPGEAVD